MPKGQRAPLFDIIPLAGFTMPLEAGVRLDGGSMPRKQSSITAITQPSPDHMTRAEILALFDRRQIAYDSLDAAALAADYAESCFVDSPTGGTHTGRAAVENVLRTVFDAFLDMKTRTETLVIDGSQVAQALTIEGTNIGGFLGVSASGRPFRVAAVFLYELKDRQIVRERRIYDFTGLLTQIGVLKTKPV
jgi:steroid delta-isomerase-like uncharacterized protein